MITHYKYTDAEIKALLKSIVILVDTREKGNKHILDYLEAKKVGISNVALPYGDYSYMLPSNTEYGVYRDLYFNDSFVIERKNSLDELSGNLAQHRDRFENEFLRAGDCKTMLLIEKGSYSDILEHNYNTRLSEKAFIASVTALQHRYNINVSFVDKIHCGAYIHIQCYYHLREYLKRGK